MKCKSNVITVMRFVNHTSHQLHNAAIRVDLDMRARVHIAPIIPALNINFGKEIVRQLFSENSLQFRTKLVHIDSVDSATASISQSS